MQTMIRCVSLLVVLRRQHVPHLTVTVTKRIVFNHIVRMRCYLAIYYIKLQFGVRKSLRLLECMYVCVALCILFSC